MDEALSPIQKPELLDAERAKTDEREEMTLDEHRDRARLLSQALEDSCAYAEQLWETLDATRRYLYESLPPEPHDGLGAHPTGAAPTGPADEDGWRAWVNAFSEVTSVLCGPHGDSGFGFTTAREAERLRRASGGPVYEGPAAPPAPAEPARAPGLAAMATDRGHGAARAGAIAVLAILALRGLRPRSGR